MKDLMSRISRLLGTVRDAVMPDLYWTVVSRFNKVLRDLPNNILKKMFKAMGLRKGQVTMQV